MANIEYIAKLIDNINILYFNIHFLPKVKVTYIKGDLIMMIDIREDKYKNLNISRTKRAF